MPSPLILGQFRRSLSYIYDTNTMSWASWDGSLSAGALNIGSVNQGTSPWVVQVSDSVVPGINIPAHDYVSYGYTGDNVTSAVYKSGGSGGTTVATLTYGYSGDKVTSITKS